MAHISEEAGKQKNEGMGLPVRLTYRDMQKMIEAVIEDHYESER